MQQLPKTLAQCVTRGLAEHWAWLDAGDIDESANDSYNANVMAKAKQIVQTKNPRTKRYVKIDRSKGRIISQKATKGPYKGVPIIKKKK